MVDQRAISFSYLCFSLFGIQMQHKQRIQKKFDYTAIVNRLRTVSWSNYK